MLKMVIKKRFFKRFVQISIVVGLCGFMYYSSLTTLQKATAKMKLLHGLNLIDNSWEINRYPNKIVLISPTFLIDGIYKSMEGPHASKTFGINDDDDDLIWLNSFDVKAINADENEQLSNDFICHTNIDFYDGEYYGKWGLHHRIGENYPRLTTMSNGIESYNFPEGFGFPMFSNEKLFTQTQILNHNITRKFIPLKHKITLGFETNSQNMKPLRSKPIYVMLPFNPETPYKGPTAENPNSCIPVTTKNHAYLDKDGLNYSGHWVIFPGKQTIKFDVTDQLNLKDSTSLHHIATHLHPFAEKLSLIDKSTNTTITISDAINYSKKTGLKQVTYFSSKEGVMLYPKHTYELVLETNNTTSKNQDMMASMALFLYDKELDEKIKAFSSHE